ncbi:hypothetical protein MGYG_04785 [Nannizzia gypsea CBS 118893]|uniref:Uncharacterized protein n=1 Tax=Arthroderma gypseum (strain ATCC MYA-4604 / CBS 118893) TaxID=535722 RepID=E4UWS9_ARTGP|nr:hypothetical protein MGYG_04785 [Nannizzia gypsea CBS 118893]EFR01782.1 hypothetical protein MGYG_04785 [Nannizzia gypsea CBS 118893]
MGGFNENESAESHLAKAFQDIAKGEQTAQAIENHLTRIEQEIDRLLGSVEAGKEDGDEVTKDDDKGKEEAKKEEEQNGSDEQGKGDKQ